jgi:hypothetical protein
MSPNSTVPNHHQWYASEIDRLAGRVPPELEAKVREVLTHAQQHAAGMIEQPLSRQRTKDPRVERNAAIVASAHAAARSAVGDALASAAPRGPAAHDSWYRRVVDRLFEHSRLGAGRYEDLDARWLSALVHRLETTPVEFPRGTPEVIQIPDRVKLAIAGDWGTGLPESDLVGAQMARARPDYMIHLGDVYYAGTPDEERRYVERWPGDPGRSLTLNSNHEMYGGGHGYFGVALAHAKFALQRGLSYFALRNQHFVIIGLDSAYHDTTFLYDRGKLDDVQLAFLRQLAAGAGDRKVILLTHHNGLGLDDLPTALWSQVVSTVNRPMLWIWGHLHAGIAHWPQQQVSGRCVGHGGIPYTPFTADEQGSYLWAEGGSANDALEPGRALNGFYLLELDGPQLTERFIDELGRQRWSADGPA